MFSPNKIGIKAIKEKTLNPITQNIINYQDEQNENKLLQ